MAENEFEPTPLPEKRRRGPTRPNVYVNIFANAQTGPDAGAPETKVEAAETKVEAEDVRAFDEPLVSTEWLERRSKRLDAFEQDLRQRALELDRREAELEAKEARLEADLYLREDELEVRERRLAELEQKLGRRESEIGSYVARLQGGFLRADAR